MSNLIQIKRSLNTATPVSLANGEMAYTANGDHLFIGSNGVVVPIGGKQTPGVLTANQALVANSTSAIDKIIVANAVITTVTANGTVGTAGQVLTSNGTTSYWAVPVTNIDGLSDVTISSVADNNILVYNSTSSQWENHTIAGTTNEVDISFTGHNIVLGLPDAVTVTTSIGAGTTGTGTGGVLANSTTVFVGNNTVNAVMTSGGLSINGTATIANGTGVWTTGTVNGSIISQGTNFIANTTQVTSAVPVVFNANVALGDATADIISINGQVNTNIVPSVTNTYSIGSTTNRWTGVWANQVTATTGTFIGSVSVGGDLVVTGNLVTQNVQSVVISDPMIYLAGNNYTSDVLDIGFAANYSPDGIQELHTGLFRDASDSGIWKLFQGSTQELSGNNVVNTAATGYTTGTLNAFLQSGGLVSNGTAITITANSTLSVGITANTLTLTTALAATSGGTGQNTYSVGDILVGAAGNSLTKLTLGTDGYVLQSNGTALVYGTLDGGTF